MFFNNPKYFYVLYMREHKSGEVVYSAVITNGYDLESVNGVCSLIQDYEQDKDTEAIKILWWKKLKRTKEKF